MDKKICLKCNKEKKLEEFVKDKTRKDGYFTYCKECCNKKGKQIYLEHKKEKIEYQKEYYRNHKEEKSKYDKIYKQNYKKRKNELHKQHCLNDELYKLKYRIRGIVTKSFIRKGYKKNTNTYKIIGCEYSFFLNYLLETFKKNYGYEWDKKEPVHVDHIIPLATAKTEEDVIKLCHYTNLQLLKAKDNLVKSSKLIYGQD